MIRRSTAVTGIVIGMAALLLGGAPAQAKPEWFPDRATCERARQYYLEQLLDKGICRPQPKYNSPDFGFLLGR